MGGDGRGRAPLTQADPAAARAKDRQRFTSQTSLSIFLYTCNSSNTLKPHQTICSADVSFIPYKRLTNVLTIHQAPPPPSAEELRQQELLATATIYQFGIIATLLYFCKAREYP